MTSLKTLALLTLLSGLLAACSSTPLSPPGTAASQATPSAPAAASARKPATDANSLPGTCETRRSRIPLRVRIHSSEVSMTVAISSLVMTAGGMHLPQPVISAYLGMGFTLVILLRAD